MHFWGSIWPGNYLVVMLRNLVHVKWKKMFPIARLASGVSTGGCRPQPPAPRDHSGAFYQEPNLAIFGCLVAAGRNPFP